MSGCEKEFIVFNNTNIYLKLHVLGSKISIIFSRKKILRIEIPAQKILGMFPFKFLYLIFKFQILLLYSFHQVKPR